jgi:hypothetical protein
MKRFPPSARVAAILFSLALGCPGMAAEVTPPTLLELAKKRFAQHEFTEAEEKLFAATEKGERVSMKSQDETENDPDQAANWSASRTIQGEMLAWLCTNPEAMARITHRGVSLEGVRIQGDVDISEAKLNSAFFAVCCAFDGDFYLTGAHVRWLGLNGSVVNSLVARHVQVDGELWLSEGFVARGLVDFSGATIAGHWWAVNSRFTRVVAEQIKTTGAIVVKKSFFNELRLLAATLGESLECDGAQFIQANGNATTLLVERAKITGDVYMRNHVRVDGTINFTGAEITRKLEWTETDLSPTSTLILQSAKIGMIWSDKKSWPTRNHLHLNGLVYGGVDSATNTTAADYIQWLDLQPDDRFYPQPYEQLASVLRSMGRDRDARAIMMAKNRALGKFTQKWSAGWLWYKGFGKLIGYGYAPSRAFWISVGMIVVGAVLFGIGYRVGIVRPTKESGFTKDSTREKTKQNSERFSENYPKFNALVFSLESFTPLLRLDQSANWAPNAYRGKRFRIGKNRSLTAGSLLRGYLWFHVIAGWILTSLWVGSITGLVKT